MTISNNVSLPENWCLSSISDIAKINPTLDKGTMPEEMEVSFVPMAAVEPQNGNIDVTGIRKFSEVKKGYTSFIENDVLFAKITPCMENGKMAVVPALKNNIGFGSTEFHVLRSLRGIHPEYLYYFVSSKTFRKVAEHYMTGAVGQKRVTAPYLSNCEIPIAPTNEQHRIVAKIEALFSELDKGIESFKTAREQLKIYRQALLKHAFSGKLTEQWRAENRDKLESAETLLQRIQAERQQRYRQQLKDWEQSKSPPAPLLQRGEQAANRPADPSATTIPPFEKGGLGGISKPKAPKSLPPLTAEELAELSELPKGWAWVKLGQLTWSVKDGPHFSPKYSGSGIPFISGGNVRPEGVDFENTKFISQELHEELCKRCKPEINDILYTKGGTTGIARVNTYNKEFSVWVHVAVLKLIDSVRPFFLQHSLNSNFCYTQAQKYTHGVGNQDLGLTRMVNIVLAICPLDEQDEVIKIIEDKISICDQLDQSITTSLQQAEALRQSILKKAFSGQLVPQDPNDEPASVLLERIRAEKAAQDQPKSRRNKHA